MSKFNPQDLKVSFKDGIGVKEPIEPRKYTLTHSDESGELFLSIGKEYDNDSIDYKMRDEVLAVWEKKDNYYLSICLQVDIGGGLQSVIIRDKVFREELPLAITAIVFGDNLFLENNKNLYESSIIVKFNSDISEYNSIEDWGLVKDYIYDGNRDDEGIDNFSSPYKMNPYQMPGPNKIKPFPIPAPIPVPPPIPNPYVNNKGKSRNIENALISILDPYIRREVFTIFGRNALYCLKRAEVLDARVVNTYGPCTEEYEVTVGLKVGKNAPYYNNMIITFIIDTNTVKVKNVKNPR